MSARVSKLYLNLLVSHLRRQNLDQELLFSSLGLERYLHEPVDREESMDFEYFLDLLHKIEDRFANKLFSAEAGRHVHPSNYGVLGWVIMACEKYGQAMDIAYRYQFLVNEVMCREPLRQGSHILSRVNDAGWDPEYIRPYIEMEFAALVHMSHFITGYMYSDVPITLSFRHSPHESLTRYMDVFKTPISFDQEYNQIDMHEIVLDAPLHGHNDQVLKMLMGQVQEFALMKGKDQEFVNQLTTYLHINIVHGIPRLEDCAAAFNISSSTLKRRLQDADTSFQDLLDHVRYSIARNLLDAGEVDFKDASCMLGFSKVSAFSRAFKRWSGMSPRDYRKRETV